MDKRYNPVDFYQDLQPSKGPEVLAYSGRVCDTYVPLVLVMFAAFARNVGLQGCRIEGQQIFKTDGIQTMPGQWTWWPCRPRRE